MSKFTLLRLLAEATGLVVLRAMMNHLTRFRNRGEDQVIDFLRPIDRKLAEELFAPKEERVVGFWTIKEYGACPLPMEENWNELIGLLQLSVLSDEDAAQLRSMEKNEIQKWLRGFGGKIEPFWKASIAFRLEQRGRLDLAGEYFQRMRHNALILEQWATSQWFYHRRYCEPDQVTAQQLAVIKALRDKARQFRRLALATLVRIHLSSLVPFHETRFLPIPSITKLRKVIRYDLLAAYAEVKERATRLARLSGEEFAREMALKV
jgi:hypothetical protein